MATGDDIEAGKVTGAESRTILHGQASEDGSDDFNGNAILIVEPDTGPIRQVRHDCHGVLAKGRGTGAGVFAESEAGDGLFGTADTPSSSGVRGESKSGVGVQGLSVSAAGVIGRSTNGAGVFGTSLSNIGVAGSCTAAVGIGIGVRGDTKSPNGVGVFGECNQGTGVIGLSNDRIGIDGSSITGTGIVGECGNFPAAVDPTAPPANGVGVYGRSRKDRGGVFESGVAGDPILPQMRLVPRPPGPDPGLPAVGQPGDFFVKRIGGDSTQGELWFCIEASDGGQSALWGLVAFSRTQRA